jgi:tetratricopeptide (TPR) repeat protein
MLDTDIRALAHIVDQLMVCHIKADMLDEFPAVLERLRSNINDPRWQRKITYFHALYALWPDWDRKAGRAELRKLGSIADDEDEHIIQLYLDLFDDQLSFSEKLELIDRILTYSSSFGERLHYKGVKGLLFLLIGDERKADTEWAEAISEARERKTLPEFERYRLAETVELLGTLRADDELLSEAIKSYELLLKEDLWTPSGRANLFRHMGDTYRRKAEWEKARQAYLQAWDINESPIFKVFLSLCLLQLNQIGEAIKTLDEVTSQELSDVERADYAFALAAVAIETGDRKRLQDAAALLKTLQIGDPLFRDQRNVLLLHVQEAITVGTSAPLIAKTRSLFAKLARFASTYLIIRPAIMGMGVDVGKMLEEFAKRQESKSRSATKRRPSP